MILVLIPMRKQEVQFRLVENFVCNVLTVKYPFINDLGKGIQVNKLAPTKFAGLWEPLSLGMKRPTCKGKLLRYRFAHKEVCIGESAQNLHL